MPSNISPVLFLDGKGEPMRFYIRPGPAKAQLHDVITAGGGVLCRLREPGAILLADPKELPNITDKSGELYVSTQYILDCVEKNQQLDEMNYRLSITQKIQTRSSLSRDGAVGRRAYTAEEDEAISNYMSERQREARGNAVWQFMEKQKITAHSWQSMKDRYLRHLWNKPVKSRMGQLKFVFTPNPQTETESDPVKSLDSERDVSSGADPAVVPEAVPADHPPELPAEETPDGDGMAAPATGHQTPGECPEVDMVAEAEDEHRESSPKRARLDEDEDGDGGKSGLGSEVITEVGGSLSSKTSPPAKGLGILDRAVREFRQSLWNGTNSPPQVTQPDTSQSESETEVFHEAQERLEAALPPQQKETAESVSNGQDVTAGDGTTTTSAPLGSCRSHLFLFEGESQENESSPTSQEEDEEGERLVLGLMKDCSASLFAVAKALLMTSGDVALARQYLLQGTRPKPLWTQEEDKLLLSADPDSKRQLQEKYGEEGVSARISFLQAK